MAYYCCFRESCCARAEQQCCWSVLGCLLVVESDPVLLAMIKKRRSSLKSPRYCLAKDIEDEDLFLRDTALLCSCVGRLQQTGLSNNELSSRCLQVVHQLESGIRRVRPGKDTSGSNNAQKQYLIADLELCQSTLMLQPRFNTFLTSLKECTQTQSPFLSPEARKPAASCRMRIRA